MKRTALKTPRRNAQRKCRKIEVIDDTIILKMSPQTVGIAGKIVMPVHIKHSCLEIMEKLCEFLEKNGHARHNVKLFTEKPDFGWCQTDECAHKMEVCEDEVDGKVPK